MLDISFIVIGLNESTHINKCLESVADLAKDNIVGKHEIIYIDSGSVDNTLDLVHKSFSDVKTFIVTGTKCAAIARNIGAKEALYKYLFFIDGDMELNTTFFKKAINNAKELKNDFISGQVIDVYADGSEHNRYDNKDLDELYGYIAGGVFLIRKDYFDGIKGFDTKYIIHEEPALSLALANRFGLKFLRISTPVCMHYTDSNDPYLRSWSRMFNLSLFFTSSVIIRDNILNVFAYPIFVKKYLSLELLLFSLISSAITQNILFTIIYFISILFVSIKKHKRLFYMDFLYSVLFDIGSIIMFFAFFPKKNAIEYDKL